MLEHKHTRRIPVGLINIPLLDSCNIFFTGSLQALKYIHEKPQIRTTRYSFTKRKNTSVFFVCHFFTFFSAFVIEIEPKGGAF